MALSAWHEACARGWGRLQAADFTVSVMRRAVPIALERSPILGLEDLGTFGALGAIDLLLALAFRHVHRLLLLAFGPRDECALCRSAVICSSIALITSLGGVMSRISYRNTFIPQVIAARSSSLTMEVLSSLRDESTSSSCLSRHRVAIVAIRNGMLRRAGGAAGDSKWQTIANDSLPAVRPGTRCVGPVFEIFDASARAAAGRG